MADSVRVDSWLWAVRVYKTRSAATAGCRAGHVKVGGSSAKASQTVRPGDEVRVRVAGFDRVLVVRQTLAKRVSAALAATAFDDIGPPRPSPLEVGFAPRRERGAGRPTKRERRELDRLRGREDDTED